jgi:hypothetical protein
VARLAGQHGQWVSRPGRFSSSTPGSPRISSVLGLLVKLRFSSVQSQVKGPKLPCRINTVSGFTCPCKCCTVSLVYVGHILNAYRSGRLVLFAMTSSLKVIATRTSRVCLRRCGSLRVTSSSSGKATMQFFNASCMP